MNMQEIEEKLDSMEEPEGALFVYKCDKCGKEVAWSFLIGLPPSIMPFACGCSGKFKLVKDKKII